jgi:hypothetical protein
MQLPDNHPIAALNRPTTVPELRRLLDTKAEAGRQLREAFAAGLPIGRLRIEYDRLWRTLEAALTDDTIAALIATAEAAHRLLHEDGCESELDAHLAPLTKEVGE